MTKSAKIKEYRGPQLFADWFWNKRPKKKEWIEAARESFNPRPDEKDVCCVCGFSFEFTEAHHVIPLSIQYQKGFVRPDHRHAWLCPNHHAVVHWLLRQGGTAKDRRRWLQGVVEEMEIAKLEELIGYATGDIA